jgi:hypothetical protein
MYEITQIKGDGETHPALSPNDEFAGFERWDTANLAGVPKQPGMIEREYARQALSEGLKLEATLGVNPFKFGFVSGTDTHTGLTTAEEDNFFGKHTGVEPSPSRFAHDVIKTPQVSIKGWQMAASGYTGVWATENTREAIWDALKRKEAYSTTGPRMLVRFFGGWDFEPADAQTRMPADAGYAKGVPMGGDLKGAPEGKSPTFLAAAMKDPLSGNLDRIQIIKGWVDETLPSYDFGALGYIGLVHFDADLYSSTKTALTYIGPYLRPGCYVVFDEFHGYLGSEDHEFRAWKEFADETGIGWTVIGHGDEQWAIRIG